MKHIRRLRRTYLITGTHDKKVSFHGMEHKCDTKFMTADRAFTGGTFHYQRMLTRPYALDYATRFCGNREIDTDYITEPYPFVK